MIASRHLDFMSRCRPILRLLGNCDEFIYLGGNEQSTHEYVSKLLGKETIDLNTYGQSRGRSGNY